MKKMLKHQIESLIQQAIQSLQKKLGEFEIPEIVVEHPENSTFGDYSTNISMKLTKALKKSPMQIGEMIKNEIENPPTSFFKGGLKGFLQKIEVAPPGFINFFIAPEYVQKQVPKIIKSGEKFGQSNIGKNTKILLEFISANPTGPIHLGNGRGGFFGDVLGNIFQETGYKVTKEYYINDYGAQIEKLGHSVLKDEQAEYKGDYIDTLHKKITSGDYKKTGVQAAKFILEKIIKKTIKEKMGVAFDNWFSEKTLHQKNEVEKIVKWLQKQNLAYEKDGALWFKSSQFGDEKDRVLQKKDGSYTYLAGDFAYHKNKFQRGFKKLINIWSADHHGDVARLKAAVEVLGHKGKLEIILMQMVRLIQDGKEVKMSKRKGVYITMDELINEVGPDVTRFFYLIRSPDSHLDFDLNLAKEQSDKNPVFYIQYGYARICSILRKVKKNKKTKMEYAVLTHPNELTLIKELIKLPELIEEVAINHNVHKMPIYAINLAKNLHSFYKNCKVLKEDAELRNARIELIAATKIVLKKTLDLMGINAPEKM